MSASLPYIVLQRSLDTCCDVHAQTDGEYDGDFHPVWPRHQHCAVATRGRRRLRRGGLERHGPAINLFLDNEIEVVIVRPDGSHRHNTYPFALFGCRSKPPVRAAMKH
jgi:hypothetical protein